MRINVYSQELTNEVHVIEKESNTGVVYSAVQFMLHSSPMTGAPARLADDRPICECIVCGRMHRKLGHPPFALTHAEACRLSRVFNESANLGRSEDHRINLWLQALISRSEP